MKKYTKLTVPKDSAWDRKTWRSYAPNWICYFVDSVQSLIGWLPFIWKDRHWDDYYILKMLQRKIELQREYLVKANRHVRIEEDNFWMTLVLNLIEREQEEYYALEQYDYQETDLIFIDIPDTPGYKELEFKTKWENLGEYLDKYPGSIRRVLKKYPDKDFSNRKTLALYVGTYNQERNRNLLFEILKRYSARWWD